MNLNFNCLSKYTVFRILSYFQVVITKSDHGNYLPEIYFKNLTIGIKYFSKMPEKTTIDCNYGIFGNSKTPMLIIQLKNVKFLYGYFKYDKFRRIYLIWKNLKIILNRNMNKHNITTLKNRILYDKNIFDKYLSIKPYVRINTYYSFNSNVKMLNYIKKKFKLFSIEIINKNVIKVCNSLVSKDLFEFT
jgi:hypothetical protein